MRNGILLLLGILSMEVFAQPQQAYQKEHISMEALDRGLIAVRQSDSLSISWRWLEEDPEQVNFDLYADGKRIIKGTSRTYLNLPNKDFDFSKAIQFRVVTHAKHGKVLDRLKESSYTLPADAPIGYIDIPLDKPETIDMGQGRPVSYFAGDCTTADVDGDGQLEIILKWDPSNQHDNSHKGKTGNVYIDCYKITSTSTNSSNRLWRIDLGPNIRAGAHYTQIMAYDFDGDGKAEIIMKTADGTTDGTGTTIGDKNAYHVNDDGHVDRGPEFLTVFEGATGRALYTTGYVPDRGIPGYWGDIKSNRSERYLATVGYLGNGNLPSVIMCRGYYTRATLVAWDWDGKELKQRWFFDSYVGVELKQHPDGKWTVKTPGPLGDYSGQGNHSLRTADIDGDGFDEIIYGSCTIDHNGQGLYSTKLGHGDAMHLMRMLPNDPKLYVWQCHEEEGQGSTLRDAETGRILFQIPFVEDCGRCMASDIDPTNPGVEMWSICTQGIRNYKGELIANPRGLSYNMGIWWDGDTLRELLDRNRITKYNWVDKTIEPMAKFEGAVSINGTKAVPCLEGDLLGDWREEVLLPTTDSQHLRLYVTPHSTPYRFRCLLQDIPYRHSLATENVGYNQPAELGSWLDR